MMKLIMSIIGLCVVLSVSYILVYSKKKDASVDLSSITDGKSSSAVRIKDASGKLLESMEIFEFYESKVYREYKGKTGNTSHLSYFFYDADDTLLFELVDLGNQNLIRIKMNGKEGLYQYE